MKRGDLIIVRRGDSFANKARPCLIVQNDAALFNPVFVNVCPLASSLTGIAFARVPIEPSKMNGLTRRSEIEIDLIETIRVVRVGEVIGSVETHIMEQVDIALRRWLDL
jgi:mRNA interferase MazF